MKTLQPLLDRNLVWAKEMKSADPDFFTRLSQKQTPEYLWIGCSDSRVSANQITDLPPGKIFVHRNIANLVLAEDTNAMAVLEYAVTVLGIQQIIVCGHYGCGGIHAVLNADQCSQPLIDWLEPVSKLRHQHADQFDDLDLQQQVNVLVELNVVQQVKSVCDTPVVKKAWSDGCQVSVHGLVYNLENGLLKSLVCQSAASDTVSGT